MEKIGLGAVLDMTGFSSGASSYNSTISNMTSATQSGANAMTSAFSSIGNIFQTAMGMISAQAIIGAFNSITGALKSFATEAMGAERVTAKLDAALTTSGRNYEAQMKKFEEASKTATTVMVSVGKALKPEEIEKYGNQLEKAKAQMMDMQKAMSSGKSVTETQKISFKQLGESVSDLEAKLAGGKLVATTMSLVQAQGLVPPVMQASREQIDALAQKMSQLTEYDDEAVASAAAVSLKFKNIGADVFPEAMEAAADLAATMGLDLSGGMQQLGIALEEPGEALGRLSRQGVNFEKSEIEMLKAMNDTGRAAEAQRIILDRLKQSIGGAAEAMGKTASGQITIFRNNLTNAKETIGNAFLPMIGTLAGAGSKFLLDAMPGIQAFAGMLGEKVKGGLEVVLATIERVKGAITSASQWFQSGGIGGGAYGFLTALGISPDMALQAEKAINAIMGPIQKMVGAFSTAFNAPGFVSSPIVDVINGIAAALETIGLGDIGANIKETFGVVFETIIATVSQIGPIVQANIGPIMGMFGTLGQLKFEGLMLGLQMIASLMPTIATAIGTALPIAIQLFTQFQTIVMQTGQAILTGLTPVIASVIGAITRQLPMIGTVLSSVMGGLGKAINTVLPVIFAGLQKLVPVFEKVVAAVVPAVGRIINAILPLATTIITTVVPVFVSLASKVGESIAKIAPLVAGLVEKVVPIVQGLVTTMMPIVERIGKALIDAFDKAAPIVIDAIGKITKMVQDNMPLIKSIMETIADIIETVLPIAIAALKKALDVIIPVLEFVFTQALKTVETVLKAVAALLKGDFAGAFDLVKKRVEGFANDVKTAFDSVWPEIQKFGATVLTEMTKIGADLINGFKKGVEDTWGNVKQWFTDRFAEIPAWAKSILGIKSPSTVFAEIGVDIMLGLAQGLQAGEAEVVSTMSDMVTKLSGALSSLFDMASKFAMGGMVAFPNLVPWFDQAKVQIKGIVDAINIFFDVDKQVSAGGLAYAADLAEIINRLFTSLSIDWAAFNMPKIMPDMAAFATAIVSTVRALVDGLKGIPDSVIQDMVSTVGMIPVLVQILSLLSVSLDVKAPGAGFNIAFDAWLAGIGYAANKLIEGLSKATEDFRTKILPKAAQLVPDIQTVLGLLSISLESFKEPIPTSFRANFDEWLAAIGYAGMMMISGMSRVTEDWRMRILPAAAEMVPLIAQVLSLLTVNLESLAIPVPPDWSANFNAWLEAIGTIGLTLVEHLEHAPDAMVVSIKRAAEIVGPLMEMLSILGAEIPEFKLPESPKDILRAIPDYVAFLVDAAVETASKIQQIVLDLQFDTLLENTSKVVGGIKGVLDLLGTEVAEFKLPEAPKTVLRALPKYVEFLVDAAIEAAQKIQSLVIDLGFAELLENTSKIIGNIKAVIDILGTQIADIKLPENPQKTLNIVGDYLALLVEVVKKIVAAVPTTFTEEVMTIVLAFGNATKAIMDAFAAGIDVFERLKTFVAPTETAITSFITAIKDHVFTPLYNFAVGLNADQMELTQTFATTFGALFGGLKDAFDLFTGIRSYVAVPAGQIKLFFDDVKLLFRSFYDEALTLQAETLDITQTMTEVITSLLSGLKSAFELMEDIRWYSQVPEAAMQDFLEDVKRMFIDLRMWAASYGTVEAFTLVNAWSAALANMIGGLKSAFDLFSGLYDYQEVTGKIVEFLNDVKKMFNIIGEFMGEPGVAGALGSVGLFVAAITTLFGALDMALNTMNTMRITAFPAEWIPEEVVQMLVNMVRIMGEGITSALPAIHAAAEGIGRTIIAALPLPETMFGYGWALGNALAQGFASAGDLFEIPIDGGRGTNLSDRESELSGYLAANTSAMQHIANLIQSVNDLTTRLEIRGTINIEDRGVLTLSDQVRIGQAAALYAGWVPA